MLNTILVPLDGSALSERALEYSTALARPTGATVLLLRAAISHTLAGVDGRERQEGAIHEVEQYLEHVAARLREQGVPCQTVAPFGHAAHCVTAEARTRHVDLIVMATHGRTGPGRWVLGSVTEAVVATSSVPVLVQRAWQPLFGEPLLHARQPTVLVALDGSAFSEAVLEPAANLAADLGGNVVLTRVAEEDEASTREAVEYLSEVQVRLIAQRPSLQVGVDVRHGKPAEGIEEAAARLRAALIAMATHGRGGITRTIFGSVAGELLRHGEVPLVLFRPAPAAIAEDSSTVPGPQFIVA